jgi:EGF-like domain
MIYTKFSIEIDYYSHSSRHLNGQLLKLFHCFAAPSPCENNPCKNGGTCVESLSGYKCNCLEGWTGPECDTRE